MKPMTTNRVERAPARPMTDTHDPTSCRAREVLNWMGDRWSVHILFLLDTEGVLRFGELRRRAHGISQRMLTVTLRRLERDGFVHRMIYPEVPPRVEYALTPLGETIREIVRALVHWSGEHIAEVDAARTRYDGEHALADAQPPSSVLTNR
jgi:DNA-binding HxlR family transcriptional regulator